MSSAIDVYQLLKDLFFTLEDGDRVFFNQFDLTSTRFYALYHLHQRPGQTLRELSDFMLCDKSNVTRVAKGLERDHLIRREQHESDGRAYRLYLTDEGALRFSAVNARHAAYNEQRFNGDINPQYAELAVTLAALKATLSTKLQSQEPTNA